MIKGKYYSWDENGFKWDKIKGKDNAWHILKMALYYFIK